MYKSIPAVILLLITAYGGQLIAQTPVRFQPTHEQMIARYRRAEQIDSLTKNAVFKSTIEAHWASDGKSFWYCNILKDSVREYIHVEAATGKKEKITSAVPELPVPAVERRQRGGRFGNFRNGSISPDKQWEAYIQKGNLFVKPVGGGTPLQFTTDGSEEMPYGAMAWSPDSKYLAGYLIHPVRDSSVYFVLTSVAGTTRGQLRQRPYKQPGDPFTTYDLYLFSIPQKTALRVNTETIDFPDNAPQIHWRYDNPRYFTYEKFDRGHQRFRVIEVDANTAQTRNIVDEKTQTFIYLSHQYTYYPQGSNLLIRSSEKDGWRHLYLVDLLTGNEQLITKGNWVVRNVDSVDMTKQEIWFTASGMNTGEDPYLIYYYRIGFNGNNLVSLTPDKGNHNVVFSPDKKYYLDTYSLVNVPPVTKLRRSSDAKEIVLLEKADVSYYNTVG
ncbi:MAG: DPP IV N-terminal domain-containing protein, partial [Bacteroidota bacterium]